ncbi:MAG TPA: hypothetical protein VGN57_18755 [Pirellulaceae bacterium]|jgi:hypothetical protein|nr:hypothetical protein [Pirellulaceae bacterium]
MLGRFVPFAIALAASLFASVASAERPPVSRVLPEDTVLYVRVPNPQQSLADMKQSGTGRMMADEKMRPIVEQLYGVLGEMYAQVEEQIGMSLEELQKIPTGEMAIAVSDLGEGEPGIAGFIDVRENPQIGDRVVETLERLMVNAGAGRSVESLGEDDELVTMETLPVLGDPSDPDPVPAGPRRSLSWFRKDELIVVTNRPEMAKVIYAFWTGQPKDKEGKAFRRLSDSGKFVTTYGKLQGPDGGDPDLIVYADPIKWVRVSLRGNFASMAVMGFFPTLGLDGIQAVGGSVDFLGGEGEYEDLQRLYVLVDRPRTGVTKALALRDGDLTPEEWMPKDVDTYMSMQVDPQIAYAEIEKMYDGVYSKGAFDEWMKESVDERVGVSVKADIVDALEGRATLAFWTEPPIRFNSGAQVIAAKLNDPEKFAKTLETIFEKTSPRDLEQRKIGEHSYWYLGQGPGGRRGQDRRNDGDDAPLGLDDFPADEEQPKGLDDFEGEREREAGQENRPRRRNGPPIDLRQQQFLVAIVGDYAMFCDSEAFLKKILETQEGGPRLRDDLDYKLVAAQAASLPGGSRPAAFTFARPEAQMKQAYELLQGEDLKRLSRDNAGSFAPLGSLNRVLEETKFPSFEEFKKYFAPSGGILVDEENGWSYTGFSLRAK